ncbi:hypothetical protein AB1M95_01935 [Sulfitobacter sp. LCG007]
MLLISLGMCTGLAMIAMLTSRPTILGTVFALAANVSFVALAASLGATPVTVLHSVLLVVNLVRLLQARSERLERADTWRTGIVRSGEMR